MPDQTETQEKQAQARLKETPVHAAEIAQPDVARPPASVDPEAQRFKAEMPQIPGVIPGGPLRKEPSINQVLTLGIGAGALILVALLGARLISRPKPVESIAAAPPPQIEVAAPAIDPNSLLPHATAAAPEIATVSEMSKPWTSKNFIFVNHLTGENVPAILVRLAQGSANASDGYWAFEINAPFGNCRLEYIADVARLINDYGFRGAKHPMVGDPCSRSVFDPLKMGEIPGNFWVRGTQVQGSDVRPPLGIELQVKNKNILALRME
jgi:hypothetical protein